MRALLLALCVAPVFAQSNPCDGTEAWSPCDWSFDLAASENPETFQLHAEFRSPVKHKTYLLHAFKAGPRRFTIRFAPTEEGTWDYRLTSNLARLQGQEGKIRAAASSSPGFIQTANVHHFATADGQPHLWMGATLENFLSIPQEEFARDLAQISDAKYTHVRVTIPAGANLDQVFERVRDINSHGIVADLVLASVPSEAAARRAYITDLASRFAACNITWMGLPAFESVVDSRAILKDSGAILKEYDPYNHPRATLAQSTSGTFGNDPWTSVLVYGTVDPNVGAVEHQLYPSPDINTAIRSSKDLWTAVMNGQYPASGEGAYMTTWHDLMTAGRYWELEPYFDIDGARAVALPGAEYIVYLEKPGPIEMMVEDHGYDYQWINPDTGERTKSKGFRGARFTGEPPDQSHPWLLYIYREGEIQRRKAYYFDSREVPIQIQQIEVNPEKTPYEVAAPANGAAIAASAPPPFSLKITRANRATRTLLIEWTGEVTSSGQGYRVIGSGQEGTFQIPEALAHSSPANMLVHVYVLNAYGKLYEIDQVYELRP